MRLIDADKGLISKIQRKTGCNFITAQEIVDSMPTVEERKKGKWIVEVWNNKEHHTCSNCRHVIDYEPCYHYCPYCGAEMEGEE